MIEIEAALAGIKGRWMTGLAGQESAPDNWKPLIGKGNEAELRLLALVGQALQVGFIPSPTDDLPISPALPELTLPTMPEEARRCFRRVVSGAQTAENIAPILELVEARGYSAHPFDWMPGTTDQHAPSLYAPWIDWLNNHQSKVQRQTLNEENWDDWLPAERRNELSALRHNNPDAARALLEAKASDVPANERLRLIELLMYRLSELDVPYLESLEKDRSAKVKVFAAQLLARLGVGKTDTELVAELADMLQHKRAKLLKNEKALGPKKLQNKAQHQRRLELFTLVPLHSIAGAFELTPRELVECWNLNSNDALNNAFVDMVASTGDDDVQSLLATRLVHSKENVFALYRLIPRLSPSDRQTLIPDALAIEGDLFQLATSLSRPTPGQMTLKKISVAADFKPMTNAIVEFVKGTENKKSEISINSCMTALGLLLDNNSAESAIEHATKNGLLASDPQLNLLHLNAALTPSDPTLGTNPRSIK